MWFGCNQNKRIIPFCVDCCRYVLGLAFGVSIVIISKQVPVAFVDYFGDFNNGIIGIFVIILSDDIDIFEYILKYDTTELLMSEGIAFQHGPKQTLKMKSREHVFNDVKARKNVEHNE